MDRNISFGEQLTVPQFKARCGSEVLGVKQNPATGKFFLVCGTTTGKVSNKIAEGKKPQKPIVSLCKSPEDAEPFWMLHEQGEGLADVFTL